MKRAAERKNPKGIENLSLEDLDEVLGDFLSRIKVYKKKTPATMYQSPYEYIDATFAKSNKILKEKAITLRHEARQHFQT